MADRVKSEEGATSSPGLLRVAWRGLIAVRRRIAIRERWPRRWWWPDYARKEYVVDSALRQHDEASLTIRRVMLVIVAYAAFCLFTLSAPDAELVKDQIKLPLLDVPVDLADFLVVGPLLLIGLAVYLHIFVGQWRAGPWLPASERLPFLFNMEGVIPRLLAGFLLYWLTPLVLFAFVYKAGPHLPDADRAFLTLLALLITAVLIGAQIRRTPAAGRRRLGYRTLWLLFPLSLLLIVSSASIWLAEVDRAAVNRGFASFTGGVGDYAVDSLAALGVGEEEPTDIQVAAAFVESPDDERPPSVTEPAPEAEALTAGPEAAPPTPLPSATEEGTPPADTQQRQMPAQQTQKFLGRGLDLAGADLTKVDLTDRDLVRADLRNANLAGVNLEGQFLMGADLRGADLTGANLSDASLREANLEGADLTDADLSGALLASTYLKDTNLLGARLTAADLSMAELEGARNLSQAQLDTACWVMKQPVLPRGLDPPPQCI